MNFKTGEVILYGTDGVCEIKEYSERKIGDEVLRYLILEPIFNKNAVIYIPVKNENLLNKIHIILSEEELNCLIEKVVKSKDVAWPENNDERTAFFKEAFENGDVYNLLLGLKKMFLIRENRFLEGTRLYSADEKTLKSIEKVLADIIAYVFGINRMCSIQFLTDKFK